MTGTTQLLARVTAGLHARGLITASGGNVSARDPGSPGQIWITPAGKFKGDLQPGYMACIGLDGEPRAADGQKPSTEWRVHCAIYRRRPDVQAVVHSHAPQATRLALSGTRFLPISLEAALLGEIPVVPFLMPGTEALAQAVASALETGAAVLMQNHGLIVAAESLEHATALTETIEATAGALLACRALGVEPPVLSDDEIREARARGISGD
jgi:ribulose-5-phosphate 4-epimerase/fuculose-1-phosphate aldolase